MVLKATCIPEFYVTARTNVKLYPVVSQEPHHLVRFGCMNPVMNLLQTQNLHCPSHVFRGTAFTDMHPLNQTVLLGFSVKRYERFHRFNIFASAYINGVKEPVGNILIHPGCRFLHVTTGDICQLRLKKCLRTIH